LVDGEYVARMEDVLDLYAEAPDPTRPVVCFDESPVQLIGEVRQPIPAKPGQLERYDYEYRRNGTVNLTCTFTDTVIQVVMARCATFSSNVGMATTFRRRSISPRASLRASSPDANWSSNLEMPRLGWCTFQEPEA
jgi:hypothetical protein